MGQNNDFKNISETTLHKSLFTLLGLSRLFLTLKYEVVVIAGVESVLVVSLAISVQTLLLRLLCLPFDMPVVLK